MDGANTINRWKCLVHFRNINRILKMKKTIEMFYMENILISIILNLCDCFIARNQDYSLM